MSWRAVSSRRWRPSAAPPSSRSPPPHSAPSTAATRSGWCGSSSRWRDGAEMEPRSSRGKEEVEEGPEPFYSLPRLSSPRPTAACPSAQARFYAPSTIFIDEVDSSTRSPRSGARRASTAARRQGVSGARPRRVRDMSTRRARGVAPRQVGAARAGAGLGTPRHISAHLGTPRHISAPLYTSRQITRMIQITGV